jgi:hypothetical protein
LTPLAVILTLFLLPQSARLTSHQVSPQAFCGSFCWWCFPPGPPCAHLMRG